jgi:hypothetical protein
MPKPTKLSWDWKSGPHPDDLVAALKPFGLIVYQDPGLEGSDSFGFIISDRELPPDELEDISEGDF